MNKIELEIVSLQSSVTLMHSYAVVLGEVSGDRKIPIVIGGFEAQAIAVALENLQPKRPLTHDLMVIFFNTFNVTVQEVYIYKLEEAIFYSQLICIKDNEQVRIDCRTSDAIAIAIRTGCPIYAAPEVVDSSGLEMEQSKDYDIESDEDDDMSEDMDDNEVYEELSEIMKEADLSMDLSKLSIEQLEEMLEQVLEREDYTMAIKIRDEIKNRNTK